MVRELDSAAKMLENPEAASRLNETQTKRALAKLLIATMAVMEKWVADGEADQIAKQRAAGDRLLGTKEMCERIGCSMATLMRRWKAGEYPFMLKDGGRLVGSEDGLERWIKNRIKRSA